MAPASRSPFVRDGEVAYVPVTEEFLKIHGVREWPVMEKDVCTFTHTYKADADVFLEHGHAIVTPKGKAPVKITAGDYAVLPAGMSCEWNIVEPVKKHYKEYE